MTTIDSLGTPFTVRGQLVPRAGADGSTDSPPMLLAGTKLVGAGLSAAEIGTYVWAAQRQADLLPVNGRVLAEWLRDQRFQRSGDWVRCEDEAAQIVHQLDEAGAIAAEPNQCGRLTEVREEREELIALFAEPEPPRTPTRLRAAPSSAPAAPAPRPPQEANHAPDEDGHWRGAWPIPADGHYPPKGQNVVYLLRAPNELVVYVGSTNHFRARMKAHQGGGKRWTSWEAIPCETRDEAYDVESEYMQIHMPHLNVAGPRGGEQS